MVGATPHTVDGGHTCDFRNAHGVTRARSGKRTRSLRRSYPDQSFIAAYSTRNDVPLDYFKCTGWRVPGRLPIARNWLVWARLPRAATVSLLPSAVWRAGVVDALFYVTSSLIHTQFAYATVNHDLNSCSNNEPPNSQRRFSSKDSNPLSLVDCESTGLPSVPQTTVLGGVSIARYDHTSITHED